ncbi:hypothetical protein ACFYUV_42160 [Nonomuraea sp. NPDC003560]|uniref:hypothetical protein n=1 Tax=Nonomuraea sp. NPDC003560 TaxID=3364341 RepID=UPI0036C40D1E
MNQWDRSAIILCADQLGAITGTNLTTADMDPLSLRFESPFPANVTSGGSGAPADEPHRVANRLEPLFDLHLRVAAALQQPGTSGPGRSSFIA